MGWGGGNRTAFDISERIPGATLVDDISIEDIRTGALHAIEELLADSLTAARDEGKARVSEFVSNRAPRYRPVLARLEPLGVTVDPSIKDQDLELVLHRHLQKLEADVIEQGHAVFAEADTTAPEVYQERLNEYLQIVTDINQSDLAAYVSRRRESFDALAKPDSIQRSRQVLPRGRHPLAAHADAHRLQRDRDRCLEPVDHR
ncbi:hypothetical protein, partial [Propioniciclava flava]